MFKYSVKEEKNFNITTSKGIPLEITIAFYFDCYKDDMLRVRAICNKIKNLNSGNVINSLFSVENYSLNQYAIDITSNIPIEVKLELFKLLNMKAKVNDNLLILINDPTFFKTYVDLVFEREKELKELLKKYKEKLEILDKKIPNGDFVLIKKHSNDGYTLKFENNRENIILSKIEKSFNSKYTDMDKYLRPYCYEEQYTDYDIIEYFKITYGKLLTLYKISSKQEEVVKMEIEQREFLEEQRLEELRCIAEETGEKQEVEHYSVPCLDPNIECVLDLVIKYIDGNGEISTEIKHLY